MVCCLFLSFKGKTGLFLSCDMFEYAHVTVRVRFISKRMLCRLLAFIHRRPLSRDVSDNEAAGNVLKGEAAASIGSALMEAWVCCVLLCACCFQPALSKRKFSGEACLLRHQKLKNSEYTPSYFPSVRSSCYLSTRC